MPMTLEAFIVNFEDAVEDLEPGTVTHDTRFQELQVWDSLAVLTVLSMIDSEYSIRLNADVFKTTHTVDALFQEVVFQQSK